MLEAIFSEGITTVTVTGLTQWDYGRKLTIKGLSYTDNVEVHFSNNIEKEAVVMEVTKSGSDLVTEVPNVLLEKNHDITAWVYIDSGTSGETVRTINLKVKPRIKPADYISENNAGKVIDYVAKAEEYASSAQESAEIAQDNAEKVQANTDLVQDILANVPDFDSYEKLAEHNKLLYDGLYVKGETYSGVASNKGIKLHSVKGKTVQQTTNGYQLFDSSKLPTKTIGGATVTNDGDGSFTISGTGNLTERFVSSDEYISMPFSLKEGKLYLSIENVVYPAPYIDLAGDSGFVVSISIKSGSKTAEINLTEEQANKINKIKYIFVGNKNEPIKTGTIKPMLYQDGDGTWEQYTGGKPAPNPDYAMPIENVEISEINSFNKNLSPKNTIEDITWATNDNQLVERVNKLPIGKYYVSMKFTLTEKTEDFSIEYTMYGILFSSNGYQGKQIRWGTNVIGTIKELEFVLEITSDNVGRFINVWLYGAGSAGKPRSGKAKITELQIEKGETKTEFVESKSAIVETSLTLAQDDIYQNGTIPRARKKVTFDGSIDEGWILTDDNLKDVLRFKILHGSNSVNYNGVCNRFPYEANYYANTEHFYCDLDSVFIFIKKTRLSTQDVAGFKTWLSTHNTVVEYKLATPTTEEYQVPTIPSYYPYTNVSTDNELTTEMTWKILADCDNSLKQEELEKRIEALEHAMLER